MNRLEALAMAVATQNDSFSPGSEAFATLNPGMLKVYSVEALFPVNENGIRVFKSFQAGWQALVDNLTVKCGGQSRNRNATGSMKPGSTLRDLIQTFKYMNSRKLVEYLRDALDDNAVSEDTPLRFFIDDSN